MDKQVASTVLKALESVADRVQAVAGSRDLSPELTEIAVKAFRDIDAVSDRIEIAAFGEDSFNRRRAKVIKRDSDEPYMETFENPQKPLKTDADEPYMHKSGKPFNGKDMPTYDDDISSSVTDRDEYNVRDLSEWSDPTKKQPSWKGGPAGKSTKQGSVKNWAP